MVSSGGGGGEGGLTKSYYASQDVLIVPRPSEAEVETQSFSVSSLENAKREINQSFTGAGRLFHHLFGLRPVSF